MFSSGSRSGFRYSDQDWLSPMGGSRPSLCCESTSEERSAGNRHATLCGSRERVTAPDDPVGSVRLSDRPYPDWSQMSFFAVFETYTGKAVSSFYGRQPPSEPRIRGVFCVQGMATRALK